MGDKSITAVVVVSAPVLVVGGSMVQTVSIPVSVHEVRSSCRNPSKSEHSRIFDELTWRG